MTPLKSISEHLATRQGNDAVWSALEAKCGGIDIAQQKAQIIMLKRKYEQNLQNLNKYNRVQKSTETALFAGNCLRSLDS